VSITTEGLEKMRKTFKAKVTLHLHGAVLTSDYPMCFVSRAACKATLPYFRSEIQEELASRLGHDRFRIKLETVPA
jgi:hypothetical protein